MLKKTYFKKYICIVKYIPRNIYIYMYIYIFPRIYNDILL